MRVVKRDGSVVPVELKEIQDRLNYFAQNPTVLNVDPAQLAIQVISYLTDMTKTEDIDNITAHVAADQYGRSYDHMVFAARIAINNHHKVCSAPFAAKMKAYHEAYPKTLSPKMVGFICAHAEQLEAMIDYERDYLIDYIGFQVVCATYLFKIRGKLLECPQDMFMREAIQLNAAEIFPEDFSCLGVKKPLEEVLKNIKACYDQLSKLLYTHATPTLFNSCSARAQLASCFLLDMEDSTKGIMNVALATADISRNSGGVGINVSAIRGKGAEIASSGCTTKGSVPFFRIFESISAAFDQGGNRRPGNFALYMQMHHPDLLDFLNMKNPIGDQDGKCPKLHIGLWVSDLFMKRLVTNGPWSFFHSNVCPDLNDLWGSAYEAKYLEYEKNPALVAHQMPAQKIFFAIAKTAMTSGYPYICFKDTVNRANMQANIGIVKSSNLCTEIMLHTSREEHAVCNLASICLPQFVKDRWTEEEQAAPEEARRRLDHEFPQNPWFDFKGLMEITGQVVVNLNNVIDSNWYPTKETAQSNFRHRPLGIGIQGLNDALMKLKIGWETDAAKTFNAAVSETLYYAAVQKSSTLARARYLQIHRKVQENCERGIPSTTIPIYPQSVRSQFQHPDPELNPLDHAVTYNTVDDVPTTAGAYPSYSDSRSNTDRLIAPIARQFHWEAFPDVKTLYDWDSVRAHVNTYGVRNSVLIAYMPTASTSYLMGCTPCFEPPTGLTFLRKTLAGNLKLVNKYAVRDLERYGLWNEGMKNEILMSDGGGSIQHIARIPQQLKDLYKNAFEIDQKVLVKLAADRQPFVDQAQSLNWFLRKFTEQTYLELMVTAWAQRLKTGVYYTRIETSGAAQKVVARDLSKFTTEDIATTTVQIQDRVAQPTAYTPSEEDLNVCLMCSS